MSDFLADDAVAAILAHMNGDHTADNLTIVRAHGAPDATSAVMTGFTREVGHWQATTPDGERPVTIRWPEPLTDRASVRRGIVAVHDASLANLGLPPRERH